eukprot:scpid59017/ scgid22662/ 
MRAWLSVHMIVFVCVLVCNLINSVGNKFSSQVSQRMFINVAGRTGIDIPSSATEGRIMTSSAAANNLATDDAARAAAHMGHSTKTAEKYYQHVNASQKRQRTFDTIRKARGSSQSAPGKRFDV